MTTKTSPMMATAPSRAAAHLAQVDSFQAVERGRREPKAQGAVSVAEGRGRVQPAAVRTVAAVIRSEGDNTKVVIDEELEVIAGMAELHPSRLLCVPHAMQ